MNGAWPLQQAAGRLAAEGIPLNKLNVGWNGETITSWNIASQCQIRSWLASAKSHHEDDYDNDEPISDQTNNQPPGKMAALTAAAIYLAGLGTAAALRSPRLQCMSTAAATAVCTSNHHCPGIGRGTTAAAAAGSRLGLPRRRRHRYRIVY